MPRATVGIDAAVGRICQGQMHLPALLRARLTVYSGAQQRMTKGHALAQLQKPVRFRLDRRNHDAEPLTSAQQKQRITDGLCRRKQQQTLRVVGDRPDTPYEALLYPPRHRLRLRQPEASSQLRRRQPTW